MPINRQLLSRLEQRLIGTPGEATLHAILDDPGDEKELEAQVEELERQAEADGKKLCLVIVHCAHEETTKPAKPEPRPVQPVALAEPEQPEPTRDTLLRGNTVRPRAKRQSEPEPEPTEPVLTAGQRRRRRRQEAFRRWRAGD